MKKENIKYIDSQDKLDSVVQSLSKEKCIYFDLEFDKNHFRYGFHLCLMQIFVGAMVYLIDPLANLKIATIFPVFEDSNIQLVCFAADEDMRLLHHIGAKPSNIADLSVAMKLLNYETLSLDNTVKKLLGEDLLQKEKNGQQKSNWFLRPLSEKQFIYAAGDVLLLPDIFKSLTAELIHYQRLDWFHQEMTAYEKKDWGKDQKPNLFSRKDQKLFSSSEWLIYKKLMNLREIFAQELDRPSYKVWDKNLLIEITKAPNKLEDWLSLKGIHPKLKTLDVKTRIENCLTEAKLEINKQQTDGIMDGFLTQSKEEKERRRAQKKRQTTLLNQFFLPIKNEIILAYGANFANFILSNKKIEGYISGDLVLLPYQIKLIKFFAKKSALDVPSLLF